MTIPSKFKRQSINNTIIKITDNIITLNLRRIIDIDVTINYFTGLADCLPCLTSQKRFVRVRKRAYEVSIAPMRGFFYAPGVVPSILSVVVYEH